MQTLQLFYKKTTKRQRLFFSILVCLFIASLIWVNQNHAFYKSSIAELIEITDISSTEVEDPNHNKDVLYQQKLVAEVKMVRKKDRELIL